MLHTLALMLLALPAMPASAPAAKSPTAPTAAASAGKPAAEKTDKDGKAGTAKKTEATEPESAAPSAGSPARMTVAVLPPVGDGAGADDLSILLQTKAASVVSRSGRYNDVHIKQIVAMAKNHGLSIGSLGESAAAKLAGRHLGAARVTFGSVRAAPGGFMLHVTAADVGAPRIELTTVQLPKGIAAAVEEGGKAIARMLFKLDGVEVAKDLGSTHPTTASDAAMRAYSDCYTLVMRQPIGIQNPSVLREAQLDQAISACSSAVEADKDFAAGWAALGLARCFRGDDKQAVDALARLAPDPSYNPLFWVGRFWLVTRYQSSEAGAEVLREAVKKHPYFLLARGYLAEHLFAIGQYGAALAAWQEYLVASPGSPFVVSQIAQTLAKMGRHTEAIAKAREALKLDPSSVNLLLELATRHLDASQVDDAMDILEPLAAKSDARGELILRYGSAKFLKGNLDGAELLFTRAIAAASNPAEWRTRGKAKFDLARIYARRGENDQAQTYLVDATREGYKPALATLSKEDKAFVELAKKTEAKGDKDAPTVAKPREASPFAVDASGNIDPTRKRPPAPANFEALRIGN
jgi:tetratricopeptide (TPR) repeat protein